MAVLFSSIFSGMAMLWDRQFGFLKETLVAPVSRLQIMAGRTLGAATVAAIRGTLILIISLSPGSGRSPGSPFLWPSSSS